MKKPKKKDMLRYIAELEMQLDKTYYSTHPAINTTFVSHKISLNYISKC